MRAISYLGFPLLLLIVINVIFFQGCKKSNDSDCDDSNSDTSNVLEKPNIYIYPETKTQLTVNLDFPIGGEVIASIPDYGNGWNVSVDTNGLIDNTYSYLFYESTQPDIWQKYSGWILKKDSLEVFFRENMSEYGFYGQEINDFVEYWIPRFNDYEYYLIFPQTIDIIEDVVILNISEEPDNLLRLFYIIKGFHNSPNIELIEPQINIFKRENYFVTEWGVVLN